MKTDLLLYTKHMRASMVFIVTTQLSYKKPFLKQYEIKFSHLSNYIIMVLTI